jgi:hypothetical protein
LRGEFPTLKLLLASDLCADVGGVTPSAFANLFEGGYNSCSVIDLRHPRRESIDARSDSIFAPKLLQTLRLPAESMLRMDGVVNCCPKL